SQQKVQFVLPKIELLQLLIVVTFSSIVSKMAPVCSMDSGDCCSHVRRTIGPGDHDLLNAPSESRSRRLITLSRSSPRRIERPDRELASRQRPSFIPVHG